MARAKNEVLYLSISGMANDLISDDALSLREIFTSIIEDAESHVLIVDAEFKITLLNPALHWIFLRAYGVNLKEGASILKLMVAVNPHLAELWRERFIAALNGVPAKAEDTYEVEGREYFWESYFKAFEFRGEKMISVLSRDITLRKVYFRKVVENEANIRATFNALADGICLLDGYLQIIDFNEPCLRMMKRLTGRRLTKGDRFEDYLKDTGTKIKQLVEHAVSGAFGKTLIESQSKNIVRYYEVSSFPIQKDDGEGGIVLYYREVTKEKVAEQKLHDQNRDLSRMNQELDRFLYSVSHDLRAPLLSIQGLTNLMRVELGKQPDHHQLQQYLDYINRSIRRLDSFILDVTNYTLNTRSESRTEEVNIRTLIDDVMQALAFTDGFEHLKTNISVICNETLFSDSRRLYIILSNLVSNSIKYQDKNKPAPMLKINATVGASLIIEVQDNGIGISEKYQEKIFSMFFRASEQSSGTGLGLFVVKNVVETMGGVISFCSRHGEGTTFKIILPNLVKDLPVVPHDLTTRRVPAL